MSNPIDFNDNDSSDNTEFTENSKVDELLPLDDDRVVETDENGDVIEEESQNISENTDPTKEITKHNFATSPWTKLGVVGGFFGVGFTIMFLTLNSLMGGGGRVAKEDKKIESAEIIEKQKKKDGDIRAKLALQKQQDELSKLNQEEDSTEADTLTEKEKEEAAEKKQVPVAKERVPVRRVQEVSSSPRRQPRRTASRNVSRNVSRNTTSRRASSPSTPTRRTSTSTVASVPRRSSLSERPQTVPPPPDTFKEQEQPDNDPLEDIERLRSLGGFGRVKYNEELNNSIVASNSNQFGTGTSPETIESRNRRGYGEESLEEPQEDDDELFVNEDNEIQELVPKWEPINIANRFEESESEQESASNGEILRQAVSNSRYTANNIQYLPEESLILEEEQSVSESKEFDQYLTSGSTIKATLLTPLIIAEGRPNKLRFKAQITEPVQSNTGEIAIPANTQVVIAIQTVDGGGGMDAEVVAFIKNGTEYSVKPGTISVLAKNGNPLVARRYKGGSRFGDDVFQGAIAGAAKVGEVINERDETVEDLPLGGTRTRKSGSRRDIPGALLEGAFGSISTSVSGRNQRRAEERASRPRIWRIKKGKSITLRVNRSIKL